MAPIAVIIAAETLDVPWIFIEGLMPLFKEPSRYNVCHGNWMSLVSAAGLTLMAMVPFGVLLVRFRAWVLSDS
jgi:hypothetical protein